MSYGQGYELGVGFMSQVQGLCIRFRVCELGLGVMGQCYELGLGFISQVQGYEGGLGLRIYDLGLGVMSQCHYQKIHFQHRLFRTFYIGFKTDVECMNVNIGFGEPMLTYI